jgi:hypothetical protein
VTSSNATAGRLLGPAVAAFLTFWVLSGPAQAAGTGGIEVSPYPGLVNGHQVTAFHVKPPTRGDLTVRYSLRNTTEAPVSGRLYAASAAPDGSGGYAVGAAGSTPYVSLKAQDVTLKPHEIRVATFTAHGRVSGKKYAAIVVEVRNGAIVQRAATLVYLEKGRTVPVPLLLALLAALVLVLAAVAVAVVGRYRGRPTVPTSSP